jgi:hypothetical protein
MASITALALKRVRNAQAELARAMDNLQEIRKRRRIQCSCKSYHRICDLTLRITHYYNEPHGCTGGDYWSEGEWQFLCPKTGDINRLLFHDEQVDWKERDKIGVAAAPTFKHIYRNLFGACVKVHERGAQPGFFNFYVDQHRRMFELPPKPEKKP